MPTSSTTDLLGRSVDVIREGQAETGAYLACPSFEPYRYCWFRDGSFIADAVSRHGEIESAERFFGWCARVIEQRGGRNLHARYTVDGREAPEEWPTFQLDGYGLWLWALRQHCERHDRAPGPYVNAIDLTLVYLLRHWREPCTDWWEEQEGIHPATLACIYAGLRSWWPDEAEPLRRAAASALAGAQLDASLLVLMTPFGVLERADPLLHDIEAKLVSPGGGVHRHRRDTYYGGGEWLLLTALLGWQYAELERPDEARAKLEWIAAHATPEGHLPEQSQDHLLAPEMYRPWVEKWGPPASPLLWSHAMFLTLASTLTAARRPPAEGPPGADGRAGGAVAP